MNFKDFLSLFYFYIFKNVISFFLNFCSLSVFDHHLLSTLLYFTVLYWVGVSMPHRVCGHQRTTCNCQFPLSIMWVKGVELRSSDLTIGTMTHLFSILSQIIELIGGSFNYQFKLNFNDDIFPKHMADSTYFIACLNYDRKHFSNIMV